jgi:hypothetical protein
MCRKYENAENNLANYLTSEKLIVKNVCYKYERTENNFIHLYFS